MSRGCGALGEGVAIKFAGFRSVQPRKIDGCPGKKALDRPVELLRTLYGEELCIGEPTIRYRQGKDVEEPHMGVRVLCTATHFDAVRDDLAERGGVITAEVDHSIAVVRTTVPLARLLGYAQHLAQLTAGSGRESVWLSHYAPIKVRRDTAASEAVAAPCHVLSRDQSCENSRRALSVMAATAGCFIFRSTDIA
ncbi:MAG TPA: hypothetical protein VGN07_23485 [Steroidobacteraceae bacterium]|jgi:predicted membrane GTPase involved in stress response